MDMMACFQCADKLLFAPKHAFGESTEKVEKRDFRAVGNGYKPPQNLYFIHYFYSFSVFSPKACLQSIDTLWIASKHAEGMSLRYDAICVPVYCG